MPVKFYLDPLRFARKAKSQFLANTYYTIMQIYAVMHLHDSVQLGISLQAELCFILQSAKLQLANLLQNCYFCLIEKTTSNSLLWSLVIKYFWSVGFVPPCLLHLLGATVPLSYATGHVN